MLATRSQGVASRNGSWSDSLRVSALAASVVLLSLGAGAAAVSAGAFVYAGSVTGVVAGVALVLVAGAPTVLRLKRYGLDGPGLYAFATSCLLGLTALAWVGAPEDPGPGLDRAAVADALRLVALGLIAFGLGAAVVGRAQRPVETAPTQQHKLTLQALVAFYCASLAGVLLTFALGAFGYISDPEAVQALAPVSAGLGLLAVLGDVVLVITSLAYFRSGDRAFLWLLVAFTISSMAIGFIGGNKKLTILPLAYIFVSFCLVNRRVPWLALAAITVFLFVFVIPTNLRYRESVRVEQQAPSSALRDAVTAPIELNPRGVAAGAREYVLNRFRSIDSVALVRTQTPSPFPFAGGRKYLLLPGIILIPRAVWPNKPVLDDAAQFTHTYGQAPLTIRSSTEITQVGDLYRNFGYAGPVVGLFLWGMVVAWFTKLYTRKPSARMEAIYVFALLNVVLYIESDLPQLIATGGKTMLLAAAVTWFLLPGAASPPGYHRLRRRGPRAAR